jgi:hypothetical protein
MGDCSDPGEIEGLNFNETRAEGPGPGPVGWAVPLKRI